MSILADINFDDVEEVAVRVELPVGTYSGRIASAKAEIHSNNGHPKVTFGIVVTDGEHAGGMVFRDYYLTPPRDGKKGSGLGVYKGACSAIGANPNDERTAIGKTCSFVVVDEPAYGSRAATTKVDRIMPPVQSSTDNTSPAPSVGMPKRRDDLPF